MSEERADRMQAERDQLLAMLDEAGAKRDGGLVASVQWLIDDTNIQQQAVLDSAKSCGLTASLGPRDAAAWMTSKVLQLARRAAGAMAKVEALEEMLAAAESQVHSLRRQRLELVQRLAVESVAADNMSGSSFNGDALEDGR